ncbi:hypothetical protein ABZT06_01905 [Streptomyces sp. NPDC005483]|uniref:hypothetical protein n=1 Tax=Streptomyces sp. NPDC005483 TaxID=3154882 RepID=UPI0033BA94D2
MPWLDAPRRYGATVRLSRAAGLPRRQPDGLGLAVRVEQADGPDDALDLLLTSCGRGRVSTGFTAADLRHGAEWMYYGGDLVEAGPAVLMGVAWYAGAGRARARDRRRGLQDTVVDRPGGGTRRPTQDSGSRRGP